MNILFICTGNTCRSPMAEGLMKQIAQNANLQVQVQSAGVAAFPGSPASTHTDTILKSRGIHQNHVSQPVTPELVQWSDLILTMTESHKKILCRHFPGGEEKVFTVNEFADDKGDVTDPYGGSLEVYQETERDLEAVLNKIVNKIMMN